MRATHLIEIDANPDKVWAATTALERWPEWNPNVSEVIRVDPGPLEIGSKALVRQSGLPEAGWTYLGARIAYLLVYVAGVFLVRSLIWNVATLSIVAILMAPFVGRI